MDELSKDKLRAQLLKQCDEEMKEAKKISDIELRNKTLESLHNKYQKTLLKIGISSWTSLIDIDEIK